MDCPECGATIAIKKGLTSDSDISAQSRVCPDCEYELSKHEHRDTETRLLTK